MLSNVRSIHPLSLRSRAPLRAPRLLNSLAPSVVSSHETLVGEPRLLGALNSILRSPRGDLPTCERNA